MQDLFQREDPKKKTITRYNLTLNVPRIIAIEHSGNKTFNCDSPYFKEVKFIDRGNYKFILRKKMSGLILDMEKVNE